MLIAGGKSSCAATVHYVAIGTKHQLPIDPNAAVHSAASRLTKKLRHHVDLY